MRDMLKKLLFLFLFGLRVEAEEARPSLEELARALSSKPDRAMIDAVESKGIKIYYHDEKSKHRGIYTFLNERFKDRKIVVAYGYCDDLYGIDSIIDKIPDNPEKKAGEAYQAFVDAANRLKDSNAGFLFVNLKNFSKINSGKWKRLMLLIKVFKKFGGIKIEFPFYVVFENSNGDYKFKRVIFYNSKSEGILNEVRTLVDGYKGK